MPKFEKPKDKCRVSPTIKKFINDSIQKEYTAAYLYKAMYAWCDYVGLFGAAKFYKSQHEEELAHAQEWYDYLLERNSLPITPGIPVPTKSEFKSLKEVLEEALKHEIGVTENYNNLAKLCHTEGDFVTLQKVNWYLNEQIEEEDRQAKWLDRIETLGETDYVIGEIDEELGELAK